MYQNKRWAVAIVGIITHDKLSYQYRRETLVSNADGGLPNAGIIVSSMQSSVLIPCYVLFMRNIDPHWYTDAKVYRREQSVLFSESWQMLGPVSAVSRPGDYISEEIAGSKVFVIRG